MRTRTKLILLIFVLVVGLIIFIPNPEFSETGNTTTISTPTPTVTKTETPPPLASFPDGTNTSTIKSNVVFEQHMNQVETISFDSKLSVSGDITQSWQVSQTKDYRYTEYERGGLHLSIYTDRKTGETYIRKNGTVSRYYYYNQLPNVVVKQQNVYTGYIQSFISTGSYTMEERNRQTIRYVNNESTTNYTEYPKVEGSFTIAENGIIKNIDGNLIFRDSKSDIQFSLNKREGNIETPKWVTDYPNVTVSRLNNSIVRVNVSEGKKVEITIRYPDQRERPQQVILRDIKDDSIYLYYISENRQEIVSRLNQKPENTFGLERQISIIIDIGNYRFVYNPS